jgi:hypothetical protein
VNRVVDGKAGMVTVRCEVEGSGRGGTRTLDLTDVNYVAVLGCRRAHGHVFGGIRSVSGLSTVMSPVGYYFSAQK